MNRVAVLTPPGTGAIATVAVAGPAAWEVVRARFHAAGGKPLPAFLQPGRFWFGTLGEEVADEVVVAIPPTGQRVEIHCHGGRRVARWLVGMLAADGFTEVSGWEFAKSSPGRDGRALEPLSQAPTLRTASILLDQYHGAFARTAAKLVARLDAGDAPTDELARLVYLASVGEHLTKPWRVVVAGPPNVGKSSLINALAGYQRAVVSPVAGTTIDAVTTVVAFDGWPVELTDTAGLRHSTDAVEAEGVGLARQKLTEADLIVWVMDASVEEPTFPDPSISGKLLNVVNKVDCPAGWDWAAVPEAFRVSAATGVGVSDLAERIAAELVPHCPEPGEAVPYLPELASAIRSAQTALAAGDRAHCRTILSGCINAAG